MSRVGTALGVAVVAAALVVTTLAPASPGWPRAPAASDASSVVPEAPFSGDRGYAMPLDGEVVREFEDPGAPWAAGHRGVDVAAEDGVPVHAAGAGVVAFVGVVVDRPVISIDHPDGIRTTYEPVRAVVARGDVVARGQVIGTLLPTSSHCPPEVCLHWGARVGDDYLDPLSLLREAVIRLYPAGRRAARCRRSVGPSGDDTE